MQKMSLQDLKDLFSFHPIQLLTQSEINPFIPRARFHGGKHAASKKNHVHKHNLSKGQLNHKKFMENK